MKGGNRQKVRRRGSFSDALMKYDDWMDSRNP
jgi:hypothetical protein